VAEDFESIGVLVKDAIDTARQQSITEILLLIGWQHNAIIENIAKMLNVLPHEDRTVLQAFFRPDRSRCRTLFAIALNADYGSPN
jgi:hypothetical protein